jgi:predicted metal-binding membrane protein
MRGLASDPRLSTAAALCFTASAAATIAWCASMSGMPGMDMPGGWTMSMAWMRMPGQGWSAAAATFLGMWTVMMIAMMLPVVVPMLAAYRRLLPAGSLRRDVLSLRVAAGYFAAWLLLGAVAWPAGVLLAEAAMRDAAIARLVPVATGIALVVAGSLQSGAWKSRALESCGLGADCCSETHDHAWRHGFELGLRCLRCCAPWTVVLFSLGVMDLAAMAFVTAAIGIERLLPRGERVARAAGVAMLAAGVLVLTNN